MNDRSISRQTAAAFAVHLFTAAGGGVAVLAMAAAFDRDFQTMFAWLGLALFIDAVDGTFARAVDVKTHAAWIDGDILDFVVDFLNYVIVPVIALWRSGLLGDGWLVWLCPVITAASALYFADTRMKTPDYWFRGFPALWNVAALYLLTFPPPPLLCALIVAVLTALMFAPIAFVHPLRVEKLRTLSIVMTIVWSASAVLLIVDGLDRSLPGRIGLVVSAVYFLGISAWRTLAAPQR